MIQVAFSERKRSGGDAALDEDCDLSCHSNASDPAMSFPRAPQGAERCATKADVDGHYWHSAAYVADWIGRHGENASQEYHEKHRAQMRAIVDALPNARDDYIDVLDLGAGWGRLAQVVLDTFQHSTLVLHDFSEPMLANARHNLVSAGDRVSFYNADLEDSGAILGIGRRFDAVVTARTLHHVSTARLASLYREVHEVLKPGGVFVNLDSVRRRASDLRYWVCEHMPVRPVAAWLDRLCAMVGVPDFKPYGGTRAIHVRVLTAAGFAVRVHTCDGPTIFIATVE